MPGPAEPATQGLGSPTRQRASPSTWSRPSDVLQPCLATIAPLDNRTPRQRQAGQRQIGHKYNKTLNYSETAGGALSRSNSVAASSAACAPARRLRPGPQERAKCSVSGQQAPDAGNRKPSFITGRPKPNCPRPSMRPARAAAMLAAVRGVYRAPRRHRPAGAADAPAAARRPRNGQRRLRGRGYPQRNDWAVRALVDVRLRAAGALAGSG